MTSHGFQNYLQSRFRLGILGEYSGDEIIDSYVCDVDLTLTTAVVQGADEPLCAPVDGLATAADITRAGEALGFRPRGSLEDGLRQMVAWMSALQCEDR